MIRQRLTGLLALLALLGLLAGLPVLLVAIGANPLPSQLPNADQLRTALMNPDDGTLALKAIAVIAWLAWAFIALAVLTETVSRLRRVRTPRLPGLRIPQGLARSLVGTAAFLFVATPLLATPFAGATPATSSWGPAQAATGPAASPMVSVASESSHGRVGDGAARLGAVRSAEPAAPFAAQPHLAHHDRGALASSPATRAHVVATGETLWSIARDHLGDGTRYPELVQLNRDVVGDDPGYLQAGWVLQIPDSHLPLGDATRPATGPASGPAADHGHLVTVQPHDTLWDIAGAELHDPAAYPEIADASRGITQPDGRHLSDPDVIDVGWHLRIPASPNGTDLPPRPGQTHHDPTDDPTDHPSNGHADDTDQRGHVGQGHETPTPPPTGPSTTTPTRTSNPTSTPRPTGEPTSLPSPAESSTAAASTPAAGDQDDRDATPTHAPPWLLLGLTGGGAVLAAGLYRGLRRRRRAQLRARRPGHPIAAPDPALAAVEKSIHHAGEPAAPSVDELDRILRQLAHVQVATGRPMPALAAVELTPHHLVLHLTEPSELAPPWEGTPDLLHWRRATNGRVTQDDYEMPSTEARGPDSAEETDQNVDLGTYEDASAVGASRSTTSPTEAWADQPAPYPMLVTVGSTDDGEVWLLNCEEFATVAITGQPAFVEDFSRYLAAELATSPWSQEVVVDCVGVAEEVVAMQPDRVRHYRADDPDVDQVLTDALADAVSTIDACSDADLDAPTGRASGAGDDIRPTRLVLISGAAVDRETTIQAVAALAQTASDHAGRTGTSLLIADDERLLGEPGIDLHLTASGRVQLAQADLDLVAVGLTSDEARGCAAILAQANQSAYATSAEDTRAEELEALAPIVGDVRTDTRCSDSGRPAGPDSDNTRLGAATARDATSMAASEETTADGSGSILPSSAHSYVHAAAVTPDELLDLTATFTGNAGDTTSDPQLDADVADWFDQDVRRPKLSLLGPVTVSAHGSALVSRKAYYTEMLAFLALRRTRGVTPDEVAEAFGLKPSRVRIDVKVVRDWLGTNPVSGERHLPDAREAPATKTRGVNVYQVDDGLLVDWDLFQRLIRRAKTTGPSGVYDLCRALELVRGRPFDQLRRGGWTWLLEGERLDLEVQQVVADAAHLVAIRGLGDRDLELARFGVRRAITVAPDEETTHLNRAALAQAEGNQAEADRILRQDVFNRSDDGQPPLDLDSRTERILRNHEWLAS